MYVPLFTRIILRCLVNLDQVSSFLQFGYCLKCRHQNLSILVSAEDKIPITKTITRISIAKPSQDNPHEENQLAAKQWSIEAGCCFISSGTIGWWVEGRPRHIKAALGSGSRHFGRVPRSRHPHTQGLYILFSLKWCPIAKQKSGL